MKYSKNQAKKFDIPGGTSGYLYPSHPKEEQSIALVSARGNYPDNGWSVNSRCTETIFVLSGSLKVNVDGKIFYLKKDDLIMIFPGQKYQIRGRAKTLDLITPAWDKSQNKIIIE
ncbi:MAG TPA: hypothetical protein PK686_03585 [bacterium]|nr:hypothetical protein [bacterium]HPV65727.1 hypothetical protein [bacterium]